MLVSDIIGVSRAVGSASAAAFFSPGRDSAIGLTASVVCMYGRESQFSSSTITIEILGVLMIIHKIQHENRHGGLVEHPFLFVAGAIQSN